MQSLEWGNHGFLNPERTALKALLPGLDELPSGTPLMNLKGPQSKGITAFRDYGGTALLVPIQHSGRGATALDAVRVQRAIGDRAAVGRGAASSGLAFDAVDG